MFADVIFFASGVQLFDVAKGLEYLHKLDITHGNIKGVGPYHNLSRESADSRSLPSYPSAM